jgi:hypothetical protein
MPDYRTCPQKLLRERFQFDSTDLDFGFYAAVNQKRDRIERFIGTNLLDAIAEGLNSPRSSTIRLKPDA